MRSYTLVELMIVLAFVGIALLFAVLCAGGAWWIHAQG